MTLLFPPSPPILAATVRGAMAPVRRVFCVARNYAAHAREMGACPEREPPFFFTAWAETVVPGGGVIAYPSATTDYQHEVELVVVIGRGGRDVDADSALSHVLGYAVGLDMTRRDLQQAARGRGGPWDAGKNVEQSSPLGVIQPAGEGFDPGRGTISLSVNGETRQSQDLSDMIWPVAEVIAHLSRLWRLEAGDLVYTGTPAGVGPVAQGDRLVGRIDGLPDLEVVIGPPAS